MSPTGVSDRFLGFLVPVFIAPVWAKSWSTFLDYARSSGRLLESRLADAVTVLLASVGLSSQRLEGYYVSRRHLRFFNYARSSCRLLESPGVNILS